MIVKGNIANGTKAKENIVRKRKKASFDKADMLNKGVKKGRWVTVNGQHKFIEDKKGKK